jgi:hypothetical protein
MHSGMADSAAPESWQRTTGGSATNEIHASDAAEFGNHAQKD